MQPRTLYLVWCIAGLILPYSQFVPWVLEHGLNMRLLVEQLFANRISAFFGLDVLVSAAVVISMVRIEGRRAGVRRTWLPILATLLVGVSLGLPLFLYLREGKITKV